LEKTPIPSRRNLIRKKAYRSWKPCESSGERRDHLESFIILLYLYKRYRKGVKPLKKSIVVELIKISNISYTKFARKYGRLTFRFNIDLIVITDNETR
jgi:hypothetical protein